MATILTIALVIWAFTYKPRKRRLRPVRSRHALPVTAPPILSPAEIARRDKEREKAAREAEKERIKAEKERQKREQAEIDIPYYEEQLKRYYEMIEEANARLKLNRQRVKIDREMNQYSAVVPEKIVSKHIQERDRAMKLVIKLENQIHGAEKNLNKAKQILNKD